MTLLICPACGASEEDVVFVGIHHEVVAEFHCLVCENDWSEQ